MAEVPFLRCDAEVSYGFYGKKTPSFDFSPKIKQIHSTHIVPADKNQVFQPEADGLWTREEGLPIGILTADCLPILLVEDHDGVGKISAIHAGWRGLFNGILDQTTVFADHLKYYWALIGPAISQKHFEVGQDVYELFWQSQGLSQKEKAHCAMKHIQTGKWHLDLKEIARLWLLQRGVEPQHIWVSPICTYADDRFYSFRRDKVREGSNVSWIVKKEKGSLSPLR